MSANRVYEHEPVRNVQWSYGGGDRAVAQVEDPRLDAIVAAVGELLNDFPRELSAHDAGILGLVCKATLKRYLTRERNDDLWWQIER